MAIFPDVLIDVCKVAASLTPAAPKEIIKSVPNKRSQTYR